MLSPFFLSAVRKTMDLACPLCHSKAISDFHQDSRREYLRCQRCQLVFVTPSQLPSRQREQQEYDLHQNHFDDSGYRRFLSRVHKPLVQRLDPGQTGLDFGCGPTPLLARMFEQQGHQMALYDPIYFPDKQVFRQQYDFITCTEAIEHFHTPAKEWALWQTMLKPGGRLAIMTKRVINADKFANWHYKNDLTHVSFFCDATFDWLAADAGMSLEFVGQDVVILQTKPII